MSFPSRMHHILPSTFLCFPFLSLVLSVEQSSWRMRHTTPPQSPRFSFCLVHLDCLFPWKGRTVSCDIFWCSEVSSKSESIEERYISWAIVLGLRIFTTTSPSLDSTDRWEEGGKKGGLLYRPHDISSTKDTENAHDIGHALRTPFVPRIATQ